MNQQQRKYARDRIYSILESKVVDVKDKYTQEAVCLTSSERFKAFKKGEFTIKKGVEQSISYYTDITDLVSFKGERDAVVNHKAIESEVSALYKQANSVIDKIMLGDADEAMKLIEEFCK